MNQSEQVKLLQIPEWLTHDLPKCEQEEIHAQIGKTMVIEKIDDHGYVWIGFGKTVDEGENAQYSGHSLCVSPDCLQKV